ARARVDAIPGRVTFTPYHEVRSGVWCLALQTHGALPPPRRDIVFIRGSLRWLAARWPDDAWWMAVNPGSPCEAYFPGGAAFRETWRMHGERAWVEQGDTLRTLWTGPLHGPVAHGLACGALLCVSNGSLWNNLQWHGTGYDDEKERLKEWWGITSREDWLAAIEPLLAGRMTSPVWEYALEVRRELAGEGGARIGPVQWRDAAERRLRAEGAGDHRVRLTHEVIGRIVRYEARFRADGLLAEGDSVRSVLAWDFGRASKMARWGLGARYCEPWETEAAVVRAGEAARAVYGSWAEFSAGYVLGRVLHFDQEEFGDWYESMLIAHQVLMSDPGSPWLNIPFR
ncbi:DUF1266 domain-containing protein, partial [Streptomyces sp. URMC 123]|uniref:DUF1266 domain-containing protein n=1 Tax=Streptomyces sp. URMC 123 TaxID=3423403 RepID=UPI003F1C5778